MHRAGSKKGLQADVFMRCCWALPFALSSGHYRGLNQISREETTMKSRRNWGFTPKGRRSRRALMKQPQPADPRGRLDINSFWSDIQISLILVN